jgi:DNA-binding NarL/FixJ family response regulator
VCAIAATEDDAVAQAAQCNPGLMIVDEQLRDGDGPSAVKRIIKVRPVPCVFISGRSSYSGKHRANELQKPFMEQDLVRAIRSVLHGAIAPALLTSPPAHTVPVH